MIDLSGAFRLRDAALYPKFYGFEHIHTELLAEAILRPCPSWRASPGHAPDRESRLLSHRGGAGARAAGRGGDLSADRLIVDAASGVTGAGRKASEDLTFAEIDEDFRAYKVLRHQHQPEIAQTLGRPLTFTPHLLPVKRGILATCYGRLAPGRTASVSARTPIDDAPSCFPFGASHFPLRMPSCFLSPLAEPPFAPLVSAARLCSLRAARYSALCRFLSVYLDMSPPGHRIGPSRLAVVPTLNAAARQRFPQCGDFGSS